MSSKAASLAQLRALRAAGKTRLSTYKVEEAEDIYDEHDEKDYNKVVRARLDQDDFVIDDNGEGYADDGREEWMGEPRYDSASGSEPEVPLKGKAGMRASTTTMTGKLIRSKPRESGKKTWTKQKRQTIASTSISAKGILPRRQSPKHVKSLPTLL